MKSRKAIASMAKKDLSSSAMSKQHKNTRECQAFYAGDFMNYKDEVQFRNKRTGRKQRAIVQINQVKPYVNAVKGFFAQNRRRAKYTAKMSSGIQQHYYTINANALAEYLRQNCNADQIETQQDGDMLINGYGALETSLTYGQGFSSTDPNGEIAMMRLDPLNVGWHKAARQPNVLDAKSIWYKQRYPLNEALDLFDDADESDFSAPTDDEDSLVYDRREWVEESVDYASDSDQMVEVTFFQWYEVETFYRCENPIYSFSNVESVQLAMIELERIKREHAKDENGLFEFKPNAPILNFTSSMKTEMEAAFGDFIKIRSYKRKVFYKAIVSGDVVFTAGISDCQQGHTIKVKTGDYDSKNNIWVGMVNSMMEPTLYYNKALSEFMFTVAANSKGGVMYEKNSIKDIDEFNENYAKTDTSVEVEEGAITGGKIQPKAKPLQSTGLDAIIGIADAALPQAVGIDKTFLGSSENRMETAQLQRQRVRQISSSLACYADSITLYQKEHARLMLDLMRIYAQNNDGSLFRVIEENGAEDFVPISAEKINAEYEISIVETQQTQEEKRENADVLLTIAQRQAAMGNIVASNAITAVALKMLTIDKEDMLRITEVIQPQQDQVDPAQFEQLKQIVQQLQSEGNQAMLQKTLADAEYSRARTAETLAGIESKVSKANADAAKVLEEARRTAAEIDLIPMAGNVNVSI